MRNHLLRNLILGALFAALTGVIAQVSFYLPGMAVVPVTLQVLAVLLAGALLGPRWGATAMLLYLFLGAIGLPVFAHGASGFGVLVGPTAGYLYAYPVAATVVGLIASAARRPSFVRLIIGMLAGLLVIYVGGAGWAILMGGKAFGVVVSGWVLPFVPLDLVKVVLAAYLAQKVGRALGAQNFWAKEGTA
jgi:biotin transport system substrate-specific component